MPHGFQSDSSMELALIILPAVAVVILLFNACKFGKFGPKLSEKLSKLSAQTQALIAVLGCLLAAVAAAALYAAIVR